MKFLAHFYFFEKRHTFFQFSRTVYRFNLFGLNQIGSQISAFVQNREDKKIEKIAEKVQAVNNRSV